MNYIREAWSGASDKVRIAIIVVVGVVVVVAIAYGVDVSGLLSGRGASSGGGIVRAVADADYLE